MFVNLETNEPAFLIAHDEAGVTYSAAADGKDPQTVPSHEFFAAHREATAEEAASGKAAKPKNGDGGKGGQVKDSGRQERHTRDE